MPGQGKKRGCSWQQDDVGYGSVGEKGSWTGLGKRSFEEKAAPFTSYSTEPKCFEGGLLLR